MSELESFISNEKLDSASTNLIKQTLQLNGFTTRLQIKLISDKNLEMMFHTTNITMGARSLLSYHIQVLRDESPLGKRHRKVAETESEKRTAYVELRVDDSSGPSGKSGNSEGVTE